jgi:paraquat-inducible protein B
MSKEPRYRWIGMFTIGGIVLAAACLVFFGRFKFFDRTYVFITYFSGSVKGLVPGAPVRFRGAKVGNVRDISIVYHRQSDSLKIPVLLELNGDSIKGIQPSDGETRAIPLVDRMIQRGLRAQLGLDSIVTGQLYVQLDFMPTVPVKLNEEDDDRYPEIPTAPSPLDKIQMTLETIPLSEMISEFASILKKVNGFVESPELHAGLVDIKGLISELRVLAQNIDQRSAALGKEVSTLAGTGDATLKNLDAAMREARPAIRDSQQALEELSGMSRAVRRLADLLERQPESVILGKERE